MKVTLPDPRMLIPGIIELSRKIQNDRKELTTALISCGITKEEMNKYEDARDTLEDIERKIWLKAYDKIDKYNKPKWFLNINRDHKYMYFELETLLEKLTKLKKIKYK